jgi:hypothetical protein
VSSCTLVWLGRRTVEGEDEQHHCECADRHRDWEEGARASQYAHKIHVRPNGLRVSGE